MTKKVDTKNSESVFFDLFREFVNSREIAQSTLNNYRVLAGAMMRFERSAALQPLTIEDFTSSVLSRFSSFYRHEPQPDGSERKRAHNTVCSLMRCLRTFFNWCVRRHIITVNPFDSYSGSLVERYPSPFYLSANERDDVATHDFSDDPDLSVQRDIFIFQCFTGCRISDMLHLTGENIVDGYLEYIARKTAGDHPVVIRVPLHPHAKKILQRYHTSDQRAPLLPFIQPQRFNYAIKRMLSQCGITRTISLLCPYTGQPIRRPINEVATSHMARRTFIGNLYRQVKDPNLISSLTGHSDNSRAFNRYRTIDDDIKRQIIMLL